MTPLKLAALWLQIYCLSIHVKGCDDCLACVSDPATINKIHASRTTAKREIHRLRGIQGALRMASNKWRVAL